MIKLILFVLEILYSHIPGLWLFLLQLETITLRPCLQHKLVYQVFINLKGPVELRILTQQLWFDILILYQLGLVADFLFLDRFKKFLFAWSEHKHTINQCVFCFQGLHEVLSVKPSKLPRGRPFSARFESKVTLRAVYYLKT